MDISTISRSASNHEGKIEGGIRVKRQLLRRVAASLTPGDAPEKTPRVTIITVVFNGSNGLEKTIKSVVGQTYKNVEYIVIDGGSTDGSIDIIRKFDAQIDYWLSEADSGIYDAMNKGVGLATGDYIGIIGAGDWYEENAISNIVETVIEKEADVVFGDVEIIDAESAFSYRRKSRIELMPKSMSSISHPSTFVKKSIYVDRPFNTQLTIAADYDLFLGLYIDGFHFEHAGVLIAHILDGGVSSSISTPRQVFKVHAKYYGFSRAAIIFLPIVVRSYFYKCRRYVLSMLLPPDLFASLRVRRLKRDHAETNSFKEVKTAMLHVVKQKLMAVTRRLDLLLAPVTFFASVFLGLIRRAGVEKMPVSRAIFDRVGVFPLTSHYYEPLFKTRGLKNPLNLDRDLPGINMNDRAQLELLRKFTFSHEIESFNSTTQKGANPRYIFGNSSFGSGDSEYLYNMIRLFKPRRLLEVGCGNSTLMARNAISMNVTKDSSYACSHICIEPYEADWLEQLGLEVIRRPVEEVDTATFAQLEENDILFIDSSHIIRPQGDVLFLFLTIIPSLQPGVLIHVHDIFTPRDYLHEWIVNQVKLWNEQYLLEALLTDNKKLEIVGALNVLINWYPQELAAACPILKTEIRAREPGSIWLRKK